MRPGRRLTAEAEPPGSAYHGGSRGTSYKIVPAAPFLLLLLLLLLFLFLFLLVFVFLLSEALLVIVIDGSMVLLAGFGNVQWNRLSGTQSLIAGVTM